MTRPVRAYIGQCLCEHVAHEITDDRAETLAHGNHTYGARRLLTHHVGQISGDVCAPCAASIRKVFPDEVTPL